jgi:hypothetical protein
VSTIHGWTAGQDGCAFYRIELPFTFLRKRGHVVTVGINLPAGDPSILVAQRTANPHATRLFQHMVRNRGVRGVYEIDDDVFSITPDSAAYEGWSYVDDLISVEANAAVAHMVTTSTDHLSSRFAELNPNVYTLPNTVPGSILNVLPRRVTDKSKLRIGWGGSATHSADWQPYAEAISKVVAEHGSTLCITGPVYADSTRVLTEPWCRTVPEWWQRVSTFDIGLAPLVDSLFNRSKSFVKVLEYAALGVPFIASPVGPYADHVIPGETGLLAATPEEWADALTQLIRSPWLRNKLGNNAREWAATWTTENHIRSWEEVYLNG